MKIHSIEVTRAQRAWVCQIHFWVRTRRQSTEEMHSLEGHGQTLLGAVFVTWRDVRRHAAALRMLPGDFSLGTG